MGHTNRTEFRDVSSQTLITSIPTRQLWYTAYACLWGVGGLLLERQGKEGSGHLPCLYKPDGYMVFTSRLLGFSGSLLRVLERQCQEVLMLVQRPNRQPKTLQES